MNLSLQIAFWFCLFLIVYSYAVYPIALLLLSKIHLKTRIRNANRLPSVSFVIAAYNEQDVIENKLRNCLSMNYPKTKIEFLIGSDHSTDGTDTLVRRFARRHRRIRLFAFPLREGKAYVMNKIVPRAKGDILVFSDANTLYHADSVRRMVSHFADAGVGGVCGKLVLVNPNDNTGGQGETLYWNYENLVKRLEGRIRTVFGATGGIYAIRKRLFQPLPRSRTSINDDFLIPMRIIAKGFDVVYDDKAKAREFVSYSAQDEFRRKVRIGTGNVFTFIHILPLLHPRHGFIAFGLWSHKIIRWAVPFLMALLFLLNVGLLGMPFFRWVFGFQVLFYLCAFAGWLVDRRGKTLKPLSICFYFVGINLALLIGYVNYFTGSIPPAWDRLER